MKLHTPSLFRYKRSYLKHDVVAALVVTAIAIPQSLAFAIIVGLPPVTGLYTALVAPIVFALFARTQRVIVGADSATAAVLASGALIVAQAGTQAHVNAIAVISLLTAAILLTLSVFRLGFLAELISRPVLIGFLAGVGLQLIITSLPNMLGLSASGPVWQQLQTVAQHIGSSNGMAMTVSILVVGVIAVLRYTRIPGELVALALAILLSVIFNIKELGVVMVGALPGGLPEFIVPTFTLEQFIALLPAAASVALIILAQGSAVIRTSAFERGEKVRLNQDLFAFSMANATAALFQGFSANGSPTRTYASENAGGKSQMVNVFMGVLVGVLLLAAPGLMAYMPQAALSAIIFVIGFYLIRVKEFNHIWLTHRTEFLVAIGATIATLTFGVLQGVFVAIIISLVERLSRQYRPKDAILLQDDVMSDWAEERLGRSHEPYNTKGLLVYSFDGSLYFENVTYFITRVKRAIASSKNHVNHVIIDSGAIDSVDYTAVEELKGFCQRLHDKSITIGFSHVSPAFKAQLYDFGVADIIGESNIYATLNEALHSWTNKPTKSSAKN